MLRTTWLFHQYKVVPLAQSCSIAPSSKNLSGTVGNRYLKTNLVCIRNYVSRLHRTDIIVM